MMRDETEIPWGWFDFHDIPESVVVVVQVEEENLDRGEPRTRVVFVVNGRVAGPA